MSRMCGISALFLIMISVAHCLSAQTRTECLAACNSNCNNCVSAATNAWTGERMIIEDDYFEAVDDAYYWYYLCCLDLDDGSGLPGRFSTCDSQLRRDLNAAELSMTMQLDVAGIAYDQALTSCFDTFRSCNESCPISLLARRSRLAPDLIATQRGRPRRSRRNVQFAGITPQNVFLENSGTDKAVDGISMGTEGLR